MECRVYILDLVTKGVNMFGHTGSGPGCFRDPAGLAVDRLPVLNVVCGFSAGWQSLCVDIIFARPSRIKAELFSVGNMLVADSRNHRLCLHDPNGRFLTEVWFRLNDI